MKKNVYLFLTIAAMLFAVQGYAQGARGHENHRQNNKARPERSYFRQTPPKQNIKEQPQYNNHHYVAPPMRNIKKPVYKHNQQYRHHRHICVFDGWSWFKWKGYAYRFIRHNTYHDRYFDSMLGYYLWGSLNKPTRIGIGSINITRYRGYLCVSINDKSSYLDLYFNQRITFQEGHTFIEIITDKGNAIIHFYDNYDNSATYRI